VGRSRRVNGVAGWGLGCDSRRDSFLLVLLGGNGKGVELFRHVRGYTRSAFVYDSRMIYVE
jgi:hypothetical protein